MSKLNMFLKGTPKCKSYQCNHPLDPPEWTCDEEECIEDGECKFLK